MPNLTHLQIEAGEFTLGMIELPNLTHAVFHTGGLSKASAKSIAHARWPKLEHLEVYVGDPTYGCDATVADIAPLLDRTDLPDLKYLRIKNAVFRPARNRCADTRACPYRPHHQPTWASLRLQPNGSAPNRARSIVCCHPLAAKRGLNVLAADEGSWIGLSSVEC